MSESLAPASCVLTLKVWHQPRNSRWGPLSLASLREPSSILRWTPTEGRVADDVMSPATGASFAICHVLLSPEGLEARTIPTQRTMTMSVFFVPVVSTTTKKEGREFARVPWSEVQAWRRMLPEVAWRSYLVLQTASSLLGLCLFDERCVQSGSNRDLVAAVKKQYEIQGIAPTNGGIAEALESRLGAFMRAHS